MDGRLETNHLTLLESESFGYKPNELCSTPLTFIEGIHHEVRRAESGIFQHALEHIGERNERSVAVRKATNLRSRALTGGVAGGGVAEQGGARSEIEE